MTSDEYADIRRQTGLTQKEAAKRLGMYQSGVSRIESGARQPTSQQAAAIILLATVTSCKKNRKIKQLHPCTH